LKNERQPRRKGKEEDLESNEGWLLLLGGDFIHNIASKICVMDQPHAPLIRILTQVEGGKISSAKPRITYLPTDLPRGTEDIAWNRSANVMVAKSKEWELVGENHNGLIQVPICPDRN
jgi:hypothetical protein